MKKALSKRGIFREFGTIQWTICIVLALLLLSAAAWFVRSVDKATSYNVDFGAFEELTDDDGIGHLYLRGLSLRKGTYSIDIGYMAAYPVGVEISLDNDTYYTEHMPATDGGAGTRRYDFEIKTGTDRGRIDFTYPEGTNLQLVFITISSDKPLYYDGLIWGIVLLLLIPCAWIGVYFFGKSTHKISLLLATAMVIIQFIPFVLNPGLFMGIDTRAHMMRIEGIYYGLLDGQFPVVVCPEWNNSYGQIGVLYPNVFLYIPAVFRLFGMSQLGAFKLFIFLIISVSTLIALASARSIFGREWQICLAVMIMCLNDMRLFNMLGDGRFGGALLAEMFYPLVAAGLIELFYQNRRKWYLIAYGIAGVFCCHIMSATIISFIVILFALCSASRIKDKGIWVMMGRAFALFIGLTLGTMVCFLKFYFSDWGQEKLQWEDFVSTLFPRGYLPDDIRWTYVFVLLAICFTSLFILGYRQRLEKVAESYIPGVMICSLTLILMSTRLFPWKYLTGINVIKYYTNMIQDSYRFLSPAVCFLAFCLPKLLEDVVASKKRSRSYESITLRATILVIVAMCFVNVLRANYDYFQKNRILYYDEVIGDVEYQLEDYLPSGTMSDWYLSDTGFISDEDAVSSLAYERAGTYVYYSYTNSKEGAYVEFPRFYYDGYVAEDEMADSVEVTKGDHNRTRVYLEVADKPAIIRMWYYVPRYMTMTCSISLGLWISSLLIVALRVYHRID